MIELHTRRLVLRSVSVDDAAFVLELMNEPGWLANIGDRGVRTVEEARDYIVSKYQASLWLVATDPLGSPVGICGLVEREGLEHRDVGYAVIQRCAGRGYATEAVNALVIYAQDRLGLETLLAITTPDNVASRRVLAKVGLSFQRMIQLPGQAHECALYSLGP